MRRKRKLEQLIPFKEFLIATALIASGALTPLTGADAQPPSCNIDELRLNGGVGWEYLAEVTTECGLENPNNLDGHLLELSLPTNIETRGIARQIDQVDLYRFAIILVAGRTDTTSGQFIVDSLLLEISNLYNPADHIVDTISGLGTGLFVIRVDLSGNIEESFSLKNGQITSLGLWDAETARQYLFEYWESYFDSADFITSNGGLDR